MKKLFLSILVIFALALTTGVNVKTADADEDCPNGCLIDSGPGCYCYQWYYDKKEGPSEPE